MFASNSPDEVWLYLAAVIYLYSYEILRWSMVERMTKTLLCDSLRPAYLRKNPAAELIHHSDHGTQYCSKVYRTLQASYNMQNST